MREVGCKFWDKGIHRFLLAWLPIAGTSEKIGSITR